MVLLILASAYFSSSETAMMALNRYRLRHLADQDHPGAKRAFELLKRPDRLIGVILLGNNFVNIVATQIATIITLRLIGEEGLFLSAVLTTAVILVFAEVVPKTLAALHPERVAFPSTVILKPLLTICYPLVWGLNLISNGILDLLGGAPDRTGAHRLNREELRTVVKEAGARIPIKHRQMLFGILDLEKATVEDIMIHRNEIEGIDLDNEWIDVVEQLVTCRHTRVPCYRGNLDDIVGVLHVRRLARLFRGGGDFTRAELEKILLEPYFVPIKTDLHAQLVNFQYNKQRIALVVDEYGDIEGLVTIDDLLGEIVGEFTTDPQVYSRDVHPEEDGSFLVDGSANIRELNRTCRWSLPTDGPKTLNGLLLEALEDIPEAGTSIRINDYTIEIVQTTDQSVKNARIFPPKTDQGI